jgi:hypothetical integral membrane protein (TIGR02206 family)
VSRPARTTGPSTRRRSSGSSSAESAEHLAALAVTAAAAAFLVAGARRWGDDWSLPVGRGLAIVILAAFVGEQLTYALRGEWTARVNLPLQLTDAVTLVSIAALWRPGCALLVELVYFWALTASLQAVLTPDLGQSFPDVLSFTYYVTHAGAIAAACLLVFGERRAPRPGAVWRVYAITGAFACLAAIGTLATGGNYMFLRRKPVDGSLLDVMGPWPVYIVVAAAFGLAVFFALDRLARLAQRWTDAQAPAPVTPARRSPARSSNRVMSSGSAIATARASRSSARAASSGPPARRSARACSSSACASHGGERSARAARAASSAWRSAAATSPAVPASIPR